MKPKKKKGTLQDHPVTLEEYKGYNQACDDFEPYLKTRLLNEDEVGFLVFQILQGYTPELAREEWTGKHYQNENKREATQVAKAIVAKFSKPEVDKAKIKHIIEKAEYERDWGTEENAEELSNLIAKESDA